MKFLLSSESLHKLHICSPDSHLGKSITIIRLDIVVKVGLFPYDLQIVRVPERPVERSCAHPVPLVPVHPASFC